MEIDHHGIPAYCGAISIWFTLYPAELIVPTATAMHRNVTTRTRLQPMKVMAMMKTALNNMPIVFINLRVFVVLNHSRDRIKSAATPESTKVIALKKYGRALMRPF